MPRPALSEVGLVCVLAVVLAVLPVAAGKLATAPGLGAIAGLLFVFAVAISLALRRGRIPFRPHWLDLAVLGWVVTVLLSCFWSVNLHRSLLGLSQAVSCLGVFFLARWLAGREEGRRLLLGGVAAGVFVSAAIGLKSYLANVVLLHNPEWRTFGPFITPNAFAGYLLVASPALVFFAVCERKEVLRGCSWFALALVVMAFFLTGSKGGILAGFISFGVLAARLSTQATRSRRRIIVLGALVAVAIALLAGAFAAPPVRERLISAGTESHSAVFRAYTWLGALKMASARPVLGWGIGTFGSVFGKFAVAGYTREAHNDYLQMGAEVGFLGLAAYLLVLWGFLWSHWKGRREGSSQVVLGLVCWSAVLGFCLHTLVDYDLPILATSATLFLLIGVGTIASLSNTPDEGPVLRPPGKVALASLLGMSLLLCGYSGASSYSESQRQAGKKQLDDDAFSSAIAYFHQATRFAPLDSEARRGLAAALGVRNTFQGRKEDLQWAVDEARRAAGCDRMLPLNWLVLGRLEANLGLEQEAEERLEQATQLAPNDPHVWMVLAESRMYQAGRASTLEARKRAQQRAFLALEQIQQIEETPAGKVKAIPDLVDLTFSRARLYFARTALEQGKPQEALAGANWTLNEIGRYRGSKSVEALRASGEEPYPRAERLEAMALLLRAEAERKSGDAEGADRDRQAALAAWSEATGAFQSFMKGGILP